MTKKKKHNQPEAGSAGQSGVIKDCHGTPSRISRASKNYLTRGTPSRQALFWAWRTPKILVFPK
jgi:hypothetical protein